MKYIPRVTYNEWVDRRMYAEERFANATSLMGKALIYYVKGVDLINKYVGYIAMYLLLVMLGILIFSVVTNALQSPKIWIMESAQFTMAAYYLLGGGYSMQQGMHVRMDFLYEKWNPRRRTITDCITIFFVLFYLWILIRGGWDSCAYALEYGQRNRTVWAPYMAPIKICMTLGMALMFLQATAELIKDASTLVKNPRREANENASAPQNQPVASSTAPAANANLNENKEVLL